MAQQLGDAYELDDLIGRGSFGDVFRAVEVHSGELVAVKAIDLESTDEEIDDIQREVLIMAGLSSPHLVCYRASYIFGTQLRIVMDLMAGSVYDAMGGGSRPLAEADASAVVCEVLRGLAYLHSHGKIHRDVKAANVLLSERGEVKLGDFGVAREITNTLAKTFVGTPFWMSPEVINQAEARYDYKADIWSLGIFALEMCHGEPPHFGTPPARALLLIVSSHPPKLQPAGPGWSEGAQDFVGCCLQKAPAARPTASRLLEHRRVAARG